MEAEIGNKTQQNLLVMDFHISPLSSKVAWLDQLHWNILISTNIFSDFSWPTVDLKKEKSVARILKMVILTSSLMPH